MKQAYRLLKLIISISFYLWDRILKLIKRMIGQACQGTCVVLLYHIVTQKQLERFSQQMDDLISLATPVSVDITTQLEKDIHHVAVTFDDGYSCTIENIVPQLLKRKIPFTIFIPTGYLGKFPTWSCYFSKNCTQANIITVKQLEKIKDHELISFGSHSMSHQNFLHLNKYQVWEELLQSKRSLEEILQNQVRLFSFPYGEYNETLIGLTKQAGYKRVFTIEPVLAFTKLEEYVTGRIEVTPTDWRLEFKLKALGAYRWLPMATTLKNMIGNGINKFSGLINIKMSSKS